MEIAEVRAVVDELRSRGRLSPDVLITETLEPMSDPNDDYRVVYELRFDPIRQDMAWMEIWITDDGYAAIRFENVRRIAVRLGLRMFNLGGFQLGHEPFALSRSMLELLLSNAALGRQEVAVGRAFGVGFSAHVRMPRADHVALADMGYGYSPSIRDIPNNPDRPLTSLAQEVIRYRPWNQGPGS